MKKPLSSVFLGALLTIGSALMAAGSDADPVVGTWKLNLAKSTFAGVPAYKSQIRTYSQSGGDLTLKMTTVSAQANRQDSPRSLQRRPNTHNKFCDNERGWHSNSGTHGVRQTIGRDGRSCFRVAAPARKWCFAQRIRLDPGLPFDFDPELPATFSLR